MLPGVTKLSNSSLIIESIPNPPIRLCDKQCVIISILKTFISTVALFMLSNIHFYAKMMSFIFTVVVCVLCVYMLSKQTSMTPI